MPSKRARIAKEDGSERKLGIAALEDKIVQQAVATVLNAIYEEDLLDSATVSDRGVISIRRWMPFMWD
jgi:hypothetical protein